MQLKSFSVKNYRSITEAHRITVRNKTILLGKNNEGKSNVLKALNIAMSIIGNNFIGKRNRYTTRSRVQFDWDRDFPVQFQTRTRGLETILNLKFTLDENEVQEFNSKFNSTLNGELSLRITINKDNLQNIEILKQGKGSKRLNDQTNKICSFISSRIKFIYIPAVRTEKHAIDVVRNILFQSLLELETNKEYKNAIKTIEGEQKKILDEISNNIIIPLQEFIPSIKNVEITIEENRRRFALREGIDVIIDDGVSTSLESKGDGIKSLAALALIRDSQDAVMDTIVAIEEPESHLHPKGIHQLKDVLNTISDKNQILISTHSPLFANTATVKSNIIINNGKAIVAKSINDIRDILGVKISDNLIHANLVLLVEGKTDQIIVEKVLKMKSTRIKNALNQNTLRIMSTNGAGKLNYNISLLDNAVCDYIVFFDNDVAGRQAVEIARDKKLIDTKDYLLINAKGMANSTIEDTINKKISDAFIGEQYELDATKIKNNSDDWVSRMKQMFQDNGKLWNEKFEYDLKKDFAQYVMNSKSSELICSHKGEIFNSLIETLDKRLSQKT